jgi:hypothetical protein
MTPAACRQAPGSQVQDRARKPQAHEAEHGQILQRVVVTGPLPGGEDRREPPDWMGRGETARGSLTALRRRGRGNLTGRTYIAELRVIIRLSLNVLKGLNNIRTGP